MFTVRRRGLGEFLRPSEVYKNAFFPFKLRRCQFFLLSLGSRASPHLAIIIICEERRRRVAISGRGMLSAVAAWALFLNGGPSSTQQPGIKAGHPDFEAKMGHKQKLLILQCMETYKFTDCLFGCSHFFLWLRSC